MNKAFTTFFLLAVLAIVGLMVYYDEWISADLLGTPTKAEKVAWEKERVSALEELTKRLEVEYLPYEFKVTGINYEFGGSCCRVKFISPKLDKPLSALVYLADDKGSSFPALIIGQWFRLDWRHRTSNHLETGKYYSLSDWQQNLPVFVAVLLEPKLITH